ncbi:MAG: enoyl-CoA hydratase/isomerase family protein [Anaerolineae bacterium]|nr:MAG: enoyl-CoA hydratase/isomerase family protein [Anaerolineae bacterium]
MPEYQHWLLTQEGHVATLTLNRPQATNNLTAETLYELRDVTAYLRGRKDVWAVVIQGQGRHFSTGMDVNLIKSRLDQPESANRQFLSRLQRCLDDFEALEKPTIAKLHGFCIGGGLILALCCDFRIASQRTVFSLPEVKLGLGVIMGTQRLTRVVGLAAAKEIILLGERFGARRAQAYGLLHQVVPPDELDAAVAALADKFQKLPPRTVGIAKRIINLGYNLSIGDSQDLEIDAQLELLDSPDLHEAIESYLEKRRPEFTGE